MHHFSLWKPADLVFDLKTKNKSALMFALWRPFCAVSCLIAMAQYMKAFGKWNFLSWSLLQAKVMQKWLNTLRCFENNIQWWADLGQCAIRLTYQILHFRGRVINKLQESKNLTFQQLLAALLVARKANNNQANTYHRSVAAYLLLSIATAILRKPR